MGCYWKEWHIWKWLNDYFYNIAFSENEKNNIIPEKTKYYRYSSEKVNVFLPLPDEVDRLIKFLNYKKNKIFASATPYAISKIPTDKYKRSLEYGAYQAEDQLNDQFMVFRFLDDDNSSANLFQYRDKRSNKIKTGVRKKGVRPVIKVKADFLSKTLIRIYKNL